jgi:hypothetical protein
VRVAVFEIVFLLVILKIPIVYLCAVVWWAIRAEPRPFEGAARPAELPGSPPLRPRRRRPIRPGSRGGPVRSYARRSSVRRVRVDS